MRPWISIVLFAFLVSVKLYGQPADDQIADLKEEIRVAKGDAHDAKMRADDALDQLSQIKVQLANAIAAINELNKWTVKIGPRLADQDYATSLLVPGYEDLRQQQRAQHKKEKQLADMAELQSAQSAWLQPMLTAETETAAAHKNDPFIPDPSGAVIRKSPDGSVLAVIGGQLLKFKSKAEAQEFIAKRRVEGAVGTTK